MTTRTPALVLTAALSTLTLAPAAAFAGGPLGGRIGGGSVVQRLQQHAPARAPQLGSNLQQIRSQVQHRLPAAGSGGSGVLQNVRTQVANRVASSATSHGPSVLQNVRQQVQDRVATGGAVAQRVQSLRSHGGSSHGSSAGAGLQSLVQAVQSRASNQGGGSSAHSHGDSHSNGGYPLPIPMSAPMVFGQSPADPAPQATSQPSTYREPAVVAQASQPIDDAGSNNAALALATLSDEELLVLLAVLQSRLENKVNHNTAQSAAPQPASQPTSPERIASIPDHGYDYQPRPENSSLPPQQTPRQRAEEIAAREGGTVVETTINGVLHYDVVVNR
jgi:hypothetical protein